MAKAGSIPIGMGKYNCNRIEKPAQIVAVPVQIEIEEMIE